ncbi:MAG: hypothetical protein QOK40_2527 [Miltoncostaeaceae bacterium]|nr:hypothetical protein [Miltoncostaeaceae bacterium]
MPGCQFTDRLKSLARSDALGTRAGTRIPAHSQMKHRPRGARREGPPRSGRPSHQQRQGRRVDEELTPDPPRRKASRRGERLDPPRRHAQAARRLGDGHKVLHTVGLYQNNSPERIIPVRCAANHGAVARLRCSPLAPLAASRGGYTSGTRRRQSATIREGRDRGPNAAREATLVSVFALCRRGRRSAGWCASIRVFEEPVGQRCQDDRMVGHPCERAEVANWTCCVQAIEVSSTVSRRLCTPGVPPEPRLARRR